MLTLAMVERQQIAQADQLLGQIRAADRDCRPTAKLQRQLELLEESIARTQFFIEEFSEDEDASVLEV